MDSPGRQHKPKYIDLSGNKIENPNTTDFGLSMVPKATFDHPKLNLTSRKQFVLKYSSLGAIIMITISAT